MIRRLSTSAVIVGAIVLAMAGGAFAAGHYLITSTSQIKPSVVKALEGRRGEQGPPGEQGQPGGQGQPGTFSAGDVSEVIGSTVDITAETAQTATASCPSGDTVISGGGFTDATGGLAASEPDGTSGWSIISYSELSGVENAYAECASGDSADSEARSRITRSNRKGLAAQVSEIMRSHGR